MLWVIRHGFNLISGIFHVKEGLVNNGGYNGSEILDSSSVFLYERESNLCLLYLWDKNEYT